MVVAQLDGPVNYKISLSKMPALITEWPLARIKQVACGWTMTTCRLRSWFQANIYLQRLLMAGGTVRHVHVDHLEAAYPVYPYKLGAAGNPLEVGAVKQPVTRAARQRPWCQTDKHFNRVEAEYRPLEEPSTHVGGPWGQVFYSCILLFFCVFRTARLVVQNIHRIRLQGNK